MPHFKDGNNGVHFLSDADIANGGEGLLPLGCIEITDAEAVALLPNISLPPVQIIVSPRQIRQALTSIGKRSAVEAVVAAGDQDLKDWWEFATQFEEGHPAVVSMAGVIGMSGDGLHELFDLAAGL